MERKKEKKGEEYTAIICLNCGTEIYCGDSIWRVYDDGDEYFCSSDCVAEYLSSEEEIDEDEYKEIAKDLSETDNTKKVDKAKAIELNIIEDE